MTHIWSHTLFPRGIKIFQGGLTKFNFLTKFPHLEKFVNLMNDLKYEHQSTFLFWGRVKINFRDRYRKPNISWPENQGILFFIIFLKHWK